MIVNPTNGRKVNMADYQETSVTGTSYKRANEVFISNPLTGPKSIRFSEEFVVNLGSAPQRVPQGVVETILTDANKLTGVSIIDPENGSEMFQLTYEQIYCVLYSLYLKVATDRDADLARIEEDRRDST